MDTDCLVTVPCTMNETVKWLTSLPTLMREVILVVTVSLLETSSLSSLPSYCRYHFCESDVKLEIKNNRELGEHGLSWETAGCRAAEVVENPRGSPMCHPGHRES